MIDLQADEECGRTEHVANPTSAAVGLSSESPGLCDLHLRLHRGAQGVMIEHRSMVNLVAWDGAAFELSEGQT